MLAESEARRVEPEVEALVAELDAHKAKQIERLYALRYQQKGRKLENDNKHRPSLDLFGRTS